MEASGESRLDRVHKIAERVDKLALAHLETTDKLNGLISLVDGHLGDHREGRT